MTQQNAILVIMVQEQQKTIKELMTTSKNQIEMITGATNNEDIIGSKPGDKLLKQGKKKRWCNTCKSWEYQNRDKCYTLIKMNSSSHSGTQTT